MTSPLAQVAANGVSIWLDDLSRTRISSGALADLDDAALSKGLLYKDTSSGTAQSATVLAGGALSLYAYVTTTVAFSVSGGSLSGVLTNLSLIHI